MQSTPFKKNQNLRQRLCALPPDKIHVLRPLHIHY
jgi:hypothetical protein